MNQDTIFQLIRYFLMTAGGAAVTNGYMTNMQLQTLVAGVITAASIAWGLYCRWNTKATPNAVAKRVDVPVVHPATGKVLTGAAK